MLFHFYHLKISFLLSFMSVCFVKMHLFDFLNLIWIVFFVRLFIVMLWILVHEPKTYIHRGNWMKWPSNRGFSGSQIEFLPSLKLIACRRASSIVSLFQLFWISVNGISYIRLRMRLAGICYVYVICMRALNFYIRWWIFNISTWPQFWCAKVKIRKSEM